ncbi:MAG: diphosphate--fructose-6-phosphate 1-phosphotransferase, partial [Chlamydiota bacterium]
LKPVIKKSLVDLKGPVFKRFAAARDEWMLADDYQYPGPIQFFGPAELTDSVPLCLS